MAPPLHDGRSQMHHSPPISARSKSHSREQLGEEDRKALFGDIPEAKKRKFILVDDPGKGGRVRVRVTLDTVDINEIPDSFRKSNSVYPRSWFPMQMQSPPPSARGSRFFEAEDEDDGVETEGRKKMMVNVPLVDGGEGEIGVPRLRKSVRGKEVMLNDLGYRMTWHQSRVFADKTVFLQKACEYQFILVRYVTLMDVQWILTGTKSIPLWRALDKTSLLKHLTSKPELARGYGPSEASVQSVMMLKPLLRRHYHVGERHLLLTMQKDGLILKSAKFNSFGCFGAA